MKANISNMNHMQDLYIEARVCQLVLKRIFDRIFSLMKSTKGHPDAFGCFNATLDDLFENLTAPISLEWEHGSFNQEERLELGKLMAELRGFFDGQRKHLVIQQQKSIQQTELPENSQEQKGDLP